MIDIFGSFDFIFSPCNESRYWLKALIYIRTAVILGFICTFSKQKEIIRPDHKD